MTDGSQSVRGAGASPVRRSVARGASGPNGPAGWTGCPGRATRPLPGSREDAPGEPRVQRQARLHRQEWHEREPCIALGREVQDVALPALPADQEVEGVLVEVGKRDLEDARGFLRDCRCGQHEQARGQMNRTPHLAVVASNPRAERRAGKRDRRPVLPVRAFTPAPPAPGGRSRVSPHPGMVPTWRVLSGCSGPAGQGTPVFTPAPRPGGPRTRKSPTAKKARERLGTPASGRHRAGARNQRPWPGLLST